jgi:geranylgeranyl diphosphate synthase type II
MDNLQQFQEKYLSEIEAVIVRFLEEHTSDQTLKDSMLYSIHAGGKRIRPLLLAATVASFRKPMTLGAYQTAAALEMIHTYSLIHDDLPAMDDDALRRGKPANHTVYGEALAILAGDGLLTAAFQLLSLADIESNKKILLLQQLSQAAGTAGMVAGQAADIQGENQQLTLEELIAVHERKTGELIRFAVIAGGILADQTEEVIDLLDQFARHLGLAFQIRDDLLDVTSTTEALGKIVHRDDALAKSTYPALLGLEGAHQALTDELTQAYARLNELSHFGHFEQDLLAAVVKQFEIRGKQ